MSHRAAKEAAVLVEGPLAPRNYSVLCDRLKGNTRLAAGVYFIRWSSGGRSMNRKLIVLQYEHSSYSRVPA